MTQYVGSACSEPLLDVRNELGDPKLPSVSQILVVVSKQPIYFAQYRSMYPLRQPAPCSSNPTWFTERHFIARMTSFPGKCVGRIPRKVLMAFQEAKMPWSGATPKRIALVGSSSGAYFHYFGTDFFHFWTSIWSINSCSTNFRPVLEPQAAHSL